MSWLTDLVDDIDRHSAVVRVTVIRADGSTPREMGAAMVVSAGDIRGTIGGGALELTAIGHARSMLAPSPFPPAPPDSPPPCGDGTRRLAPHIHTDVELEARAPEREAISDARMPGTSLGTSAQWAREVRDFPLGPSLGQCCGGYVQLLFEVLAEAERGDLRALAQPGGPAALLLRPLESGAPPFITADRKEHRPEWPLAVTRAVREMLAGARPRAPLLVRGAKGEAAWLIEPLHRPRHRLYIYGAGHVGRAIVRVLEDLPFAVTWVDTAPGRFPARVPPHANAEIAPDPAAFAASAESAALHLVLTYSHPLDLAICHSLLRRGDFRFLGLIGSTTKRARFRKRLTELGIGEARLDRLVCPIGLPGIGGKEPAMIALSVAAQLVQVAAAAEASAASSPSAKGGAAP